MTLLFAYAKIKIKKPLNMLRTKKTKNSITSPNITKKIHQKKKIFQKKNKPKSKFRLIIFLLMLFLFISFIVFS